MRGIPAFGALVVFFVSLVAVFPLHTASMQRALDRHHTSASMTRQLLGEPSSSPNVLIAYASTSQHTATLAEAISHGLLAAGAAPSAIKVMGISKCDVRLHVLGWADVILIGGPVERGNMTSAMAGFITTLSRLAGEHVFLQGKLAAAFATGGGISARAEAIVHEANGLLEAAGFTVPTFKDSWHFSTGLVAITGEDPYCHIGQTDRFPHQVGAEAIMSGCQVEASEPMGSLHPVFTMLSQDYSQRLYTYAALHLHHRRTWLPEQQDRLLSVSSQLSRTDDSVEQETDWGEWGDVPAEPPSMEQDGTKEALAVQQPQTTSSSIIDLLGEAVASNKPYFAALLCAGMLLGAICWTWLGRGTNSGGLLPLPRLRGGLTARDETAHPCIMAQQSIA